MNSLFDSFAIDFAGEESFEGIFDSSNGFADSVVVISSNIDSALAAMPNASPVTKEVFEIYEEESSDEDEDEYEEDCCQPCYTSDNTTNHKRGHEATSLVDWFLGNQVDENLTDMLERTSVFMREIVHNKTRPSKRVKVEPPRERSLHRACTRQATTVEEIDQLLRLEPAAASAPATLYSNKKRYNHIWRQVESKLVKETYQYPLNLALHNKADQDVIAALLVAAPSVLSKTDGDAHESSLAVAIKYARDSVPIIEQMIAVNPTALCSVDRKQNTPLHVAVAVGASTAVLGRLIDANPSALRMKNYFGQTPCDVAVHRTVAVNEATVEYLMQRRR